MQQDSIGLGFVDQQVLCDLIILRGHIDIAIAIIAGLGVIWLNSRFNKDDIGVGDYITNVIDHVTRFTLGGIHEIMKRGRS